MKISAVLVAILGMSACQRPSRVVEVSRQNMAFIVPRDSGIESRALLSAKLLRWNAAGLHWYETGVVRAEMSSAALAQVKADPMVAMVLTDKAGWEPTPSQAPPGCAAPIIPVAPTAPAPAPSPIRPTIQPTTQPVQPTIQPTIQVQPPAPPPANQFQGFIAPAQVPQFPPINQGPSLPMNSVPINPGGIAPVMPSMGLVDTLAGGFMNKVINRPASCKIVIGKRKTSFSSAGGDGSIAVEASGSCAWQAQSSVPWIKILSGTGVSGSGIITYSIEPGEGSKRAGSISIISAATGSPIKGKATQVINQNE